MTPEQRISLISRENEALRRENEALRKQCAPSEELERCAVVLRAENDQLRSELSKYTKAWMSQPPSLVSRIRAALAWLAGFPRRLRIARISRRLDAKYESISYSEE